MFRNNPENHPKLQPIINWSNSVTVNSDDSITSNGQAQCLVEERFLVKRDRSWVILAKATSRMFEGANPLSTVEVLPQSALVRLISISRSCRITPFNLEPPQGWCMLDHAKYCAQEIWLAAGYICWLVTWWAKAVLPNSSSTSSQLPLSIHDQTILVVDEMASRKLIFPWSNYSLQSFWSILNEERMQHQLYGATSNQQTYQEIRETGHPRVHGQNDITGVSTTAPIDQDPLMFWQWRKG